MSSTVISIENLSKYYRLGVIGGATFREEFSRWWASRLGRPDPYAKIGQKDHGNRDGEYIWALRDISLEVKEGEILGVIGRNGAGKSTLLKILSRITAPTSGRAVIRGRVGSLLEVGTGFHPELTGRENIYLNGTLLGMSRAEVDRKLDEIVEFAEMAPFIDTPVKRYSSGMTVRLAFAVAAHLEPEILIVDEVLSVGDAAFQKKCIGKMGDVAGDGRTVLFVSHNMGSITRLCERVVWIKNGKLEANGGVDEMISSYLGSVNTNSENAELTYSHSLLCQVVLQNKEGNKVQIVDHNSVLNVRIQFQQLPEREKCVLAVRATNSDGVDLFTSWDRDYPLGIRPASGKATCQIPPNLLKPGEYTLTILIHEVNHHNVSLREEISAAFRVTEVGYNLNRGRVGVIAPSLIWNYEGDNAAGQ